MAGSLLVRPGVGDVSSHRFRQLPFGAQVIVAAVIATAAALLYLRVPQDVPNVPLFVVLLMASSLAAGYKLRLPLGSSASTLSISYTFDFAAMLLLGVELSMVVAAVSAWTQSTVAADRQNPYYRIAYNVAVLVITVFVAGTTFTYLGGQDGLQDVARLPKPLVASVLLYYVTNTALVASAIALASSQRLWPLWQANFLWTAPSYFVGAAAAACGVSLWQTHQEWLLPLALAPVYLTFRSYCVYLDRIAVEKKLNEETERLHSNAVAALEAARRSEERYALAAAGANDGLWDWDIATGTLYCSDRWRLMLGLPAEHAITTVHDWMALVIREDLPMLRSALDVHLTGQTTHFEHVYRILHASGEPRWVLCRGIAVRDHSGTPIRMAGSQTDITESRRVHEALERAAREDPLTGLPNRRCFSELLERTMAQASRSDIYDYAVLLIDLDGFKLVNDSLGHVIGDEFLMAIARRLKSRLRPSDVLARVGGDEFYILIDREATPHEVRGVAERLQQALADPFVLGGRDVYASASVGIILGDARYTAGDELLRDVDTAMYRAKSAGRGCYQLFDPAMHAKAMERLTLETDLRRAVERNELTGYYQPIVDLQSHEIRGFESLARWKRADGSMAMPGEFIEIAEETGLIVPMTYHILRDACRHTAAWQQQFGRPFHVSVNISRKVFARPDFVDHVEQALAETGLHAGTLRLEITESVLLNQSELVERTLRRLRAVEVAIDLDDFGTGYSSLGYLQQYRIDALKLDKSFVARMGTGDCPIANAIVTIARELRMGLIAEGIETAAQAEALLALDCPHAQGILFSEPIPAARVTQFLREFGLQAPLRFGGEPSSLTPTLVSRVH